MATAMVDLAKLLEGIPAGSWVAISEAHNKVMSYGPDPQAVLDEARAQGESLPLIVRVPEQALAMFL